MKICSNEKCKLHLSKESQGGDTCYYCHAPLEEIALGEKFNFSGLFQNFNLGRINPKVLIVIGVLVGFSLLGYVVYRLTSSNTKNNTETLTKSTVDVEIIKTLNDYIKNERYDSVWAIINRNIVEASNIEKASTVVINQTDCENARNWEVYSTDNKLIIKILPNREDFNRWIQANNFEKIQQYIHDEGFTVNDIPVTVIEWLKQLKIEKIKGEKLFVLRNPQNNQYHNVGVYDLRKSIAKTDLLARFKDGWSLNKVEVKAAIKSEIKSRIEAQISSLNNLIDFAKTGEINEEDIKMVFGGVDVSKIDVIIHSNSGGSRNENLKVYLENLASHCKNCKILPVSCTPTESAFNGDSKNVYLRDVEFLEF